MKYFLLFFLLLSLASFGQGNLTIDNECSMFGTSVSDQLSYFEDETAKMSIKDFLEKKSTLEEVKMTVGLENMNFTNSSFISSLIIKVEGISLWY